MYGKHVDVRSDPRIRWHQKIEIDGWESPGLQDVNHLFQLSQIPSDLSGLSCIDIGTTNGATAFELARRGAEVVATDICEPEVFGVQRIAKALRVDLEFMQTGVYELPSKLGGRKFDIVILWGVLYHLRHPLLALDSVFQVSNGLTSIETEIVSGGESTLSFFRTDELAGDASNWFAPTQKCLEDMVASSGFEVKSSSAWGNGVRMRGLVEGTPNPGKPEFMLLSYERQIQSVSFSDLSPFRSA